MPSKTTQTAQPSKVRPPKVPSYRLHRPSGQAFLKVRCKVTYLGVYGSDASREAYAAAVAEVLLGRDRVVFLGPRSQAILLRYLGRDPKDCCYRPRDSEAKRRAKSTSSELPRWSAPNPIRSLGIAPRSWRSIWRPGCGPTPTMRFTSRTSTSARSEASRTASSHSSRSRTTCSIG